MLTVCLKMGRPLSYLPYINSCMGYACILIYLLLLYISPRTQECVLPSKSHSA